MDGHKEVLGCYVSESEGETDREIEASFDRLERATKQRLLPWSLPNLMRKTVFFFVLFHR